MKLAAISGVNGVFSDDDIARVRELALAERARRAGGRRRGRVAALPAPAPLDVQLVPAASGEPLAAAAPARSRAASARRGARSAA
jgi:hypothetical protein